MPAARTAASLPLLRGGRLLLGMGGGRVDIASLEDNIGVQQVIAERVCVCGKERGREWRAMMGRNSNH